MAVSREAVWKIIKFYEKEGKPYTSIQNSIRMSNLSKGDRGVLVRIVKNKSNVPKITAEFKNPLDNLVSIKNVKTVYQKLTKIHVMRVLHQKTIAFKYKLKKI